MAILHTLLWIFVIVFGINLLYKTYKSIEAFDDAVATEDKEATLTKEINKYITLSNDVICEVQKQAVDEKIEKKLADLGYEDKPPEQVNPRIRNAVNMLILKEVINDAKGFLFPCPTPTDPVQIPNNIEQYIAGSSIAFLPKLVDTLKEIQKKTSCPKQSVTRPERESFIDAATDPAKDPTTAISNDPELKKQRIQALQIKIDSFNRGFASKEFQKFYMIFLTLKELKKKAESGGMSSNCPGDGRPD